MHHRLHRILLTALFAIFAAQVSAMFIQPDWLDPTQPGVGTNRYSYSNNDPINLMDPTGNSYSDPNAILDDFEDDDRGDGNHALGDDALENLGIGTEVDPTEEGIEQANRRNVRPGQSQSPASRFEAVRDQRLRQKIDAARARLGLGPATYAQPPNFQPSSRTNAVLQQQLNNLQQQLHRSQGVPLGNSTPVMIGRGFAPPSSVPNSIYEQHHPNGALRSRTFYDNNGMRFNRQDFDHSHGGQQPHQHNMHINGYGQRIAPNTHAPLNPFGWR